MITTLLGYKPTLFLSLIIGYYVLSNNVIGGFLKDIVERFNIVKQLKTSNAIDLVSKSTSAIKPTNSSLNSRNTKKSINNLQTIQNGQETDEFCNKQSEILSIDDKIWGCNKQEQISPDILQPVHAIPYNYYVSSENNILYNIDPVYTKNKLAYEKKLNGDVVPDNSKLVHNNYDKDVASYKIIKEVSTYLNTKEPMNMDEMDIAEALGLDIRHKSTIQNVCFIKDPITFDRTIQLLSRFSSNYIEINWNIPVLPKGFMPDKLYWIATKNSKLKMDRADIYEIPLDNLFCKLKADTFELRMAKQNNRISFFLKTPVKHWYHPSKDLFRIRSKVVFLFKFYDNLKQLKPCFMESNISKIN